MALLKQARRAGYSKCRLVVSPSSSDGVQGVGPATSFEVFQRMQRFWEAAPDKRGLPPPLVPRKVGEDRSLLDIVYNDVTPMADFVSEVPPEMARDPYFVVVNLRQSNSRILEAIELKRRLLGLKLPDKPRRFLEGSGFAFLFLYEILLEGEKPTNLAWQYLLEYEGDPPAPTSTEASKVRRLATSARKFLIERTGLPIPTLAPGSKK